MRLSDRSFKVFIYSGLGVCVPVLAIGMAMLLSGYRISSEAKFWLWIVVVLSAIVMVFFPHKVVVRFHSCGENIKTAA